VPKTPLAYLSLATASELYTSGPVDWALGDPADICVQSRVCPELPRNTSSAKHDQHDPGYSVVVKLTVHAELCSPAIH